MAGRHTVAALLIGGLLLSACSGSTASTGLDGRWHAEDYDCPLAVMHHELVQVVQHGSHIVATKIVGDNCVRSGLRTFEGTVHGRTGSVDHWVGLPGWKTPLIGLRNRQLTVVSANRFTVQYESGRITYTRLSVAGGKAGGVPWWLCLLVAVAAIAVVGALFVRRRRRRRTAWSDPRLWGSPIP